MNRLKPAGIIVALAVAAVAVVARAVVTLAVVTLAVVTLGTGLDCAAADKSMQKPEEPSAGLVNISSPVDGAKLSGSSAKLVFDVTAAPKGEHVHVFVDGDEVGRLHEMKGSYTVDKLAVGKHWLCIRVVDKGHTPIGAEKCVSVIVGNIPPMGY
jgi:hypothetical protein